MDISKYLSKVIGIYLIFVGVAIFINSDQFVFYIKALINNAPLMFVTGFITLILGILMVVAHNIWEANWKVLVTIMSWLILIKGATILLFPQFMDQTTIHSLSQMNLNLTACFELALGLMYSYFGFRRSRDTQK